MNIQKMVLDTQKTMLENYIPYNVYQKIILSMKFSPREIIVGWDLSSIIWLGFNKFWIIVLPQLFSTISSNMSKFLTLNSFSNFKKDYVALIALASSTKPCQFGFI